MRRILDFVRSKYAAIGFALAFPAITFGQDASNGIDLTFATDLLDDLQTAIEDFLDAAKPFLLTALGIAVVVTLVWVGFKWFKKGVSKG